MPSMPSHFISDSMYMYLIPYTINDHDIFPNWLHVLTARSGLSLRARGEESWEGRIKAIEKVIAKRLQSEMQEHREFVEKDMKQICFLISFQV
jgi:hypothetical protein